MDVNVLEMAGSALLIMLEPTRLLFLAAGVLVGLGLGVVPGLGGIIGMALLLPFTFTMDAYTAFAFLLGMGSVTATSDTIPAILFGVPGTVGSAATILDGYPLAKQGQAGRALGAAYSASLLGGLFGALLLGVSVPILRPVMLYLGSPELLAFAVFGLSMVAVLSGGSPLRGLVAASFGLMASMVGSDPQTATLRWTLDTLYLWDGLPLVAVTLGLFAVPEIADLAIARTSIAANGGPNATAGQWQGVKDTLRNWWLVIRVSWLGSALGAVPGIGSSIIDWVAYGHAARTEKGASETFGKGDIRGVIASEGSNNAKEGGALVPTIAFGVPGSASMAILLGAFLIHGLIPGPDMLGKNLEITYSMAWSVALANVLGAGLCFMFSNQFAKIALLRFSIITPLILTVIFVGSYQGSRQWGDFFTLLFFGVLGWLMKRMGWPRPPLILGFVLGGIVERYLFISIARYGAEWLLRPVVALVFAVSLVGLLRPLLRELRSAGGAAGLVSRFSRPGFDVQSVFYLAYIALIGVMVYQATTWNFHAKVVPLTVGYAALIFAILSLLNYTFRKSSAGGAGEGVESNISKAVHFDIRAQDEHLPPRLVARRALAYLGWILAFMASTAVIGMLPTVLVFVVAYMRVEGSERWILTWACALGATAFSWFVFDYLLLLPWPGSLLGDWFPVLRDTIPSM